MSEQGSKADVRRSFRAVLEAMSPQDRQTRSIAACALLSSAAEFQQASVVMLFLSTPIEIDTAALALKCWQAGKTVVVPKVSWDQKRMLPVEISSLHTGLTTSGHGIREPAGGKPVPVDLIDLVVVPGLGFTRSGYRIGRGMGFYDRFLGAPEFVGVSCGFGFEEQVMAEMPLQDHDARLNMLVTDSGIRRFAGNCIGTA
jgi:5-formyltetrahydrofolate cyclo-ligase